MPSLRCCQAFPFALVFAAALWRPVAAQDQPNVLILFTDDQRADTIAALGNPDIHTPNLDKLARRGCNVSSAYCLGANMGAVCRPSRNMLLSGRTYFRWANPTDGSKPARNAPPLPNTLPATFNAAGYETYHHGKRGNTAERIHEQFDHSHYLDDFYDRWSMEAGKNIVDDAIDFLGNRNEPDSPWLMYLAFATPHDPRAASREALERYDAETLQLPANIRPAHPFDNGAVLVRDEWTALWPRSPQILRSEWHDYYATITTIDANIGRLIKKLEADDSLDNTIVVFSSDHGLGMGSHGLMGKQNVYEAGYKPPMIIAGPGVRHQTKDDPVYLMDLFPTLCELTGVPVPEGLDGKSFASMVTGDAKGPHDAVMLSYTDVQRSVRQGDWKLIRYPQINRSQLFHLAEDPHEMNDLSGDSKNRERIEQLMQTMRELQAAQGDTLRLTSDSPKSATFDPPVPRMAEQRSPQLSEQKPGSDELHSTVSMGWTGKQSGTPFVVKRGEQESLTAISVGTSREDDSVVTGLRFDWVGARGDKSRYSVIAGDPDSRWTPLLDQMRANRQPVGIHGAAGHVIDRLGVIQTDGRVSPAFGGSGGDTRFRILFGHEDAEPKALADAFRGFHGTVTTWNGQPAIESLGLLFAPTEPPRSRSGGDRP